MPDWRVNEFEGNAKDGFARSNNCIAQNQVSGKSSQDVISERNNVELPTCNSECIQNANGLAPQDVKLTDGCSRGHKVEPDAFAFCGRDSVSETRDPSDKSNSCHFALSNSSDTVNHLSVVQNGLNYGEIDLPYYDWPEIDNFEDVDRLFRKCDSTYGQHLMDNADQLSWLPSSSDAVYSSDVAPQPGLQSSYSEFDVFKDLPSYQCPENKLLPAIDLSAAVCDKSLNADYPFDVDLIDAGEEEGDINLCNEQVYEGGEMELLPPDQTCNGLGINGSENLEMIGKQYSSENITEQPPNQKLSFVSATKLSPSQNLATQKHPLESTSSSYITSNSYPENNGHLSPAGVPFAGRASKVQKKVMKLQKTELTGDNMMAGHPSQQALINGGSKPGQNWKSQYEIEQNELKKRSLEIPTVQMDSSIVMDGSIVSSLSSNDSSLEETSFRQLQDAMTQLDVKTKLCIRDSLYRLARSVKRRQGFPNSINGNGESEDTKEIHNAGTSAKFEPLNVETETNPIDRSIAMLLFHQPSDPTTGAVDDATSLKSRASDEHNQAPIKNRSAVPTPLYSPRSLGSSGNIKCRKNY